MVRVAGLLGRPDPSPPVKQPHNLKKDIRRRTEEQNKLDSEAFLRVHGNGTLHAPAMFSSWLIVCPKKVLNFMCVGWDCSVRDRFVVQQHCSI